MSAARCFAEAHAVTRPSFGPAFRASMRPTLVPASRETASPMSLVRSATEAPPTQRSATVHPRFEAAARHEAQSLLAAMKLNADFLSAILDGNASPGALDVLDELRVGIERLEQGFASVSCSLALARPR